MADHGINSLTRKHDLLGVLRDIAYVSFGKYGQYVVTVATLPLIARVLGAEGLGLLAIGMSSYFIGSMVVDLGITSFLAARVNEPDINQLRGNYLAIRITTLVVITCALLVSLRVGVEVHVHMILLGLLAGGFWSVSEDWLLIGQGRFGASMAYQAAGRFGYLILLVVLLPIYPNTSIPVLCMLISSIATVALTWRASFRTFGRPSRPRHVGSVLRMAAPVFTSRLLVTSYGQGTAAIYSSVLDAASLGLFSAGDRIVRAIQSLLDPIGFALLPRMAQRSEDDRFWRHAVHALLACLCAAAVATALLWIAAPLLIQVIFGGGFANAVPLLRTEVFILPAAALTSFVTTAVLTVRQDTAGVLIGAIIGTCIAAVALAVAFRMHSVWTLVYGTVAAEFAVALWYVTRMRYLYLREKLGQQTVETHSDILVPPGEWAMKIVLVGDNWVGSNARSLANGFRQAGHEVIVVDSEPVTLPMRLSPAWVYAKLNHRRAPWSVEAVHSAIDNIVRDFRPDLLFGFKTVHLDQGRLLETPASLHVHYSPDDVSQPNNISPEYLDLENQWDLIVTTKRHNVPELCARGVRAVKFVHSAYDPALHHQSARSQGRQYLVGFVGACRPDRRDEMTALARRYGNRMLIHGPGWRRVPELRFTPAMVSGPVYGERFSAVIASIQANLVLLNSANRDTHTCRTFEVPAAGGLFVGERTEEHELLLEQGTECLLFSNQTELIAHLEWCEHNPDLANKIADAGHRRITRGGHRYVDRAREIIDALT